MKAHRSSRTHYGCISGSAVAGVGDTNSDVKAAQIPKYEWCLNGTAYGREGASWFGVLVSLREDKAKSRAGAHLVLG
jgi:hypothetical protein